MKELTAKIAAAYLGANVFQSINEGLTQGVYGKLVGIEQDRCYALMNDGKTQSWAFYPLCQLILKELSSISDEDAIEVAKLCNFPEWYRRENFGCDYLNMITIGRFVCNNLIEDLGDPHSIAPKSVVKITDYLRSKGYDLGYGDIPSLITEGIAIKQS